MRNVSNLKSVTAITFLFMITGLFQNCSGVGFNGSDSPTEKANAEIADLVDREEVAVGDPEIQCGESGEEIISRVSHVHPSAVFLVCNGTLESISHIHPDARVYLVNSTVKAVTHIHPRGKLVLINSSGPNMDGVVKAEISDHWIAKCGQAISASNKCDSPSSKEIPYAQDNLTVKSRSLYIAHILPHSFVRWVGH